MQQCKYCHESKKMTEFPPRGDKQCKSCKSEYDRSHRQTHGSADKRIRDKLKSDKECENCGREDFLEFDHIDPKNKTFTIASSTNSADIVEESKKCRMLCIGCHRLHTKSVRDSIYNDKLSDFKAFIKKIRYRKNGRACMGPLCNGKILPSDMFLKKNKSGEPIGRCERCNIVWAHDRNQKTKKYINKMKRNLGFCDICNLEVIKGNEICFDWDHVDPSTKKISIASFTSGASENR